jgi:hypothetical protein
MFYMELKTVNWNNANMHRITQNMSSISLISDRDRLNANLRKPNFCDIPYYRNFIDWNTHVSRSERGYVSLLQLKNLALDLNEANYVHFLKTLNQCITECNF